MNSNQILSTGLIAAGLTSIIYGVVILCLPEPINKERDAIYACEKDLPRSQKCVLIAVPETKK